MAIARKWEATRPGEYDQTIAALEKEILAEKPWCCDRAGTAGVTAMIARVGDTEALLQVALACGHRALMVQVSTEAVNPLVGETVLYMLTEQDAMEANRRRTTGDSIRTRMGRKQGEWPEGAQAHIGMAVAGGQLYPMMVVQAGNLEIVSGQVFLPGNDVLWVTALRMGTGMGTWRKRA